MRPESRLLFENLKECESTIYSICLGVLHHPQDAEDAAQEAMLEAIMNFPQLRNVASFRPWLYRLVYRTAVDHWRRRQAYSKAKDQGAPLIQETAPDESHFALHEAISRLPDEERALLIDYYFERTKLEDLARREGVSPVAIWKRLERIRDRLKRDLACVGFAAVAALESFERVVVPDNPVSRAVSKAVSKITLGGAGAGAAMGFSRTAIWAATFALAVGAGAGYVAGRWADRPPESARHDPGPTAAVQGIERPPAPPSRSAKPAESTASEPRNQGPVDAPAGFEDQVRAADWGKHVRTVISFWKELEESRAQKREPQIDPDLARSSRDLNRTLLTLAKSLGLPAEDSMGAYDHPAVRMAWNDALVSELAGGPLADGKLEALRKTSIYDPKQKGGNPDHRLIEAWMAQLEFNLRLIRESRQILTPEEHAQLERNVTPTFMMSFFSGYREKAVKADASDVARHWIETWKLADESTILAETVAAEYVAAQLNLAARYGGSPSREAEIEALMADLQRQASAEKKLAQLLPVEEPVRRSILRGHSALVLQGN